MSSLIISSHSNYLLNRTAARTTYWCCSPMQWHTAYRVHGVLCHRCVRSTGRERAHLSPFPMSFTVSQEIHPRPAAKGTGIVSEELRLCPLQAAGEGFPSHLQTVQAWRHGYDDIITSSGVMTSHVPWSAECPWYTPGPMHTFLGMSLIGYNETHFLIDRHRIVLDWCKVKEFLNILL